MGLWDNVKKAWPSAQFQAPSSNAGYAGDAANHWWLAQRGDLRPDMGISNSYEMFRGGIPGYQQWAEDRAKNAYAGNWNITQASPGMRETRKVVQDEWGVPLQQYSGTAANIAGGTWGPIAGAAAGWGLNSQFGEETDWRKASREAGQGAASGVVSNYFRGDATALGKAGAAKPVATGTAGTTGSTGGSNVAPLRSSYQAAYNPDVNYGPMPDTSTYSTPAAESQAYGEWAGETGIASQPTGNTGSVASQSSQSSQPTLRQQLGEYMPNRSTVQTAYPWAQMALNYWQQSQAQAAQQAAAQRQQAALQQQVAANQRAVQDYMNLLQSPRDFYADNPALAQQRQNRLDTLESQQLAKTGGMRGGNYARDLMRESTAFDQAAYQQQLQNQMALVGATNPMMSAYVNALGTPSLSQTGLAAGSAQGALSDWQFQQLLDRMLTAKEQK